MHKLFLKGNQSLQVFDRNSGQKSGIFCSTTKVKFLLIFQFVADGIFKAELNEFLTRELAEDGYSGVEVRVTPTRTEIIILATR